MATFRVGVGSFNIKDGAVGFGTEIAGLGNLRVKGVTKTTGSIVSGASTLTRYSGFAADNINQLENVTLTSEVGTIGDIVVGVGTSVIISTASTVTVGTVESVSIGTHFSPPVGDTEDRGQDFVEGMMRFNTDLNTLEFYNGNEWKQFTYISDIQNSPSTRGRGVVGAGYISSPSTVYYSDIQFFSLASGGQAESFGDVLSSGGGRGGSSFSSSTRGLFATGRSEDSGSSGHNTIEYITIASAGDTIDFGDASEQCYNGSGCSSSTRGVFNLAFVGGSPVYNNIIEYVEMSTLGNSADFGDLTDVNSGWCASVSSSTRGFWGGFYPRGDGTIDVVNIASKGNATLFGGAGSLFTDYAANACSNSIRGIYAGGSKYPNPGSGYTRLIQYITMASDGNAIDFGDLNQLSYSGIGVASQTRGCIVSGLAGEPDTNYITTIQDIFFSSGGTANHFGDISIARRNLSGVSDSHGGLGGY